MIPPSYDMRIVPLATVAPFVESLHAYGSVGKTAVRCFAVYERDQIVAAYVWLPPPPGAAKLLAPECPGAVLALSRMVAVDRAARALRHVSTPLRAQMRLLDRGRYPVLVTYSDRSVGHTGHVYKCSGWRRAGENSRPIFVDETGARRSQYSGGKMVGSKLTACGRATLTRWEHRVCLPGAEARWLHAHGWRRSTRGYPAWVRAQG